MASFVNGIAVVAEGARGTAGNISRDLSEQVGDPLLSLREKSTPRINQRSKTRTNRTSIDQTVEEFFVHVGKIMHKVTSLLYCFE